MSRVPNRGLEWPAEKKNRPRQEDVIAGQPIGMHGWTPRPRARAPKRTAQPLYSCYAPLYCIPASSAQFMMRHEPYSVERPACERGHPFSSPPPFRLPLLYGVTRVGPTMALRSVSSLHLVSVAGRPETAWPSGSGCPLR